MTRRRPGPRPVLDGAQRVTVHLEERHLRALRRVVAQGLAPDRSAAVRMAIDLLDAAPRRR